ALLEIGEQVSGVAAKYLVAALPAQHHLQVPRRELRHDELRERARPGHREVEMIDHIVDVVAKMPAGDINDVQSAAQLFDREPRVIALVITGELRKPAVEAVVDAAPGLAGKKSDQARIEPARDIGADRDIAA